MSPEQFANNAQTTLSGPLTAGTNPIPVTSASGFPAQAQYRIRIDNEILLVTSGAGTTSWGVTRGVEGTSAAVHASGAAVTHVLTAAALQNLDASVIASGQLALARGGTANDLSGTGGSGQYVKQSAAAAALTVGVIAAADLPIFVASGPTHAPGAVPDPGSTADTTRFLREDATWQAPPTGFANPMTTLGDLLYENATPAAARLPGNTSATKSFLTQTGTGSASAAPAWGSIAVADLPNLAGLSGADVALTDAVVVNKAGTNNTETVARLGGFSNPGLNGLRLSYDSGRPITVATYTGQQTLYWVPYISDRYSVYDGNRWVEQKTSNTFFPLGLTQTLSCTYNTGSKTLTVTSGSTAQLVEGMMAAHSTDLGGGTITGIAAGTVTLSSFPLATQSSAVTVTFTLPASTAYDVYLTWNGGTPQLQFGNAWTTSSGSSAARADTIGYLDGVLVNTAAINGSDSNGIPANTGRYLGTICTTGVGTGEDTSSNRLLWNYYHQKARPLNVQASGTSANTTGDGWTAYLGATYQVTWIRGYETEPVHLHALGSVYSSAGGNNGYVGISVSAGTSTNSALETIGGGGANICPCSAAYDGFPGIGQLYAQLVQTRQSGGGNVTFNGTAGLGSNELQAGLTGWVWG